MICNRLIMNDEIINKKYTFWEKIVIDNIHCFEDFVRCGIPLWQPRYFFIYLYMYTHCTVIKLQTQYFAESHIPHISGVFSLRSPPPFLPHHFFFFWLALIANLIPSLPPQHIHVFVKINPLSYQYWYNPEVLVLTYPNLFWLGVFSYNQMNIFLVSLHLVTSYPASIFGLKTPCNFIFFFINYSFLYLKLLLQLATPPLPFTLTYNVSLLYVLSPLISWVIRTCVSPVCKCTF